MKSMTRNGVTFADKAKMIPASGVPIHGQGSHSGILSTVSMATAMSASSTQQSTTSISNSCHFQLYNQNCSTTQAHQQHGNSSHGSPLHHQFQSPYQSHQLHAQQPYQHHMASAGGSQGNSGNSIHNHQISTTDQEPQQILIHQQQSGQSNFINNPYQQLLQATPIELNCCVPTGCRLSSSRPLTTESIAMAIRVLCSNQNCSAGQFMHRECFEGWQAGILVHLRSAGGRARSWSDKQRLQNLWTKKGYELVYRACGCKCNQGQLRKDLNWVTPCSPAGSSSSTSSSAMQMSPSSVDSFHSADSAEKKRRGRRNKKNNMGANLAGALSERGCDSDSYGFSQHHIRSTSGMTTDSGNGGSASHGVSPRCSMNSSPASSTADVPAGGNTGAMIARPRSSSISSSGSGSAGGGACHSPPASPDQMQVPYTSPIPRSSVNPFFNGDRSGNYDKRGVVGLSSSSEEYRLFSTRSDYSVFNSLPRHKLNRYHIKMEDDDRSDDIRNFILTTLAQHRTTRIPCVVCHTSMNIFERYPLLDGTLFLSPRKYSPGSVPVSFLQSNNGGSNNGSSVVMGSAATANDRGLQFLNGVCMRCLEDDWQSLRCIGCRTSWTGGHLIIGTLYSYDVFAAQPCCEERLRCNRCGKLVIEPDQRIKYFFSDYSHSVACPHCRVVDFHFVKSLDLYSDQRSEDH